MFSEVVDKLRMANVNYACDVDMSHKTWIRRGPVVPIYVVPTTAYELENTIRILLESGMDYKVIGHTSNLYMMPTYRIDAIVTTHKMKSFRIEDELLICDSGVSISHLAEHTVREGLEGFEGFVGLPGTVGAAVVNNASCYKSIASECFVSATLLRFEDDRIVKESVGADFFEFTHRNSSVKNGKQKAVLLSLIFRLRKTKDADALTQRAEWNRWHRKTYQESKAQNLGSIFASRSPKRVGLDGVSPFKFPLWLMLKLADRYLMGKPFYQFRRSHLYLRLYGYSKLIPYVSQKNDNCFIWRDEHADELFEQYVAFMHKSCDCGCMEVEICK